MVALALKDYMSNSKVSDDFVKSKIPNVSFDDLILNDDVIKQIEQCSKRIKHHRKLYNDWEFAKIDKKSSGMVMNFFGPPGTGKTMGAEALAKSLNKRILEVDYTGVFSELHGKSSKNLQNFFHIAKNEDAILFFDEADTVLSQRSKGNSSADDDNNLTKNVMLKALDNFDGIVIFATNNLDRYDSAFERRISSHIEFKLPCRESRIKILKHMISNKVPGKDKVDFYQVSDASEGLSGGHIKSIVINALTSAAERNELITSDLIKAIEQVPRRKSNS